MARLQVSSRAVLLALAIPLLGLACETANKEAEVRKLRAQSTYEQGLRNLGDKRVALGLANLRQAIELDPDNPVYHNALGVVLLDLQKPDEALAEFQKAVALDPSSAEAYHNTGVALAELKRYDNAIAAYRKAISFPTYTTPEVAYYNMGNAYLYQGKLAEAEEAYRAAIQLESRLVAAHYQLGLALAAGGRKEQAKDAFRSARDLDPSSPFSRAAVEALKTLGEGR